MKSNRSQQLTLDRIKDLRENTDFVFTLFESLVGYSIIAADFDGNIIAYNEGAHQIYGYAPQEVVGKQNIEIFFPRQFIKAGKLQRIIDGLIAKERASYEGEKVKKNGESFPAKILFTLTKDRSGRVIGFVEVVEDLTERRRMEEEQARQREQLERELRLLEQFPGASESVVTAQSIGQVPMRQGAPDIFEELVERYGNLMDLELDQRAFGASHDTSESLRTIAGQLGFLRAGPRDVVEIHSTALKRKTKGINPKKTQAYVEEARLMVLELMGYLVSYYRTNSIHVGMASGVPNPVKHGGK